MAAGIRVKVTGLEKLQKNHKYIFIASHSSVFDIPALYVILRHHRIGFLAKKELYSIPLFGRILRSTGSIEVDRNNPRNVRNSLNKAVQRLKNHATSLALFPEGTRSEDGKLGAFEILWKKSLMVRPGLIQCEIEDPIDMTQMNIASKNELSDRISCYSSEIAGEIL